MFELASVSKRYGEIVALAPTDLTLADGETVALIGTSGSGKSTLLRLMLGLIRPDTGTVRFDGQPLERLDAAALRRQLGYVVQGGGLFPHLSAEGNVALVARYLGWPRERVAARVAELAELMRLPRELLLRHPVELSGGQAQRVSLMRALMLDPRVLLLDEPLGALDPITRHELQQDLRDVFARLRKTVLLVTHDLAEASFFARRLVLLRAGRIVQQGTLEALIRTPAEPFVTRFVQAQRGLPTAIEGAP